MADHESDRAPGNPAGGSRVGSADPLLARLVAAWPKLDAATRAAILAMLDAAAE
jgi:hypothetical protein